MAEKSVKRPEKIGDEAHRLISQRYALCGLPDEILPNLVRNPYDLHEDTEKHCRCAYYRFEIKV